MLSGHPDIAIKPDAVRVFPDIGIAVRRGKHHLQFGALRDLDTSNRAGTGIRPEQALDRGIEAQELIDRSLQQARIFTQLIR